jgi:hypothetical protein
MRDWVETTQTVLLNYHTITVEDRPLLVKKKDLLFARAGIWIRSGRQQAENNMTITGSPHRRTRAYQLVYCRLLGAAQHRGLVSYAEISDILESVSTAQEVMPDVGDLLRAISEDEHDAGRPMLTALVVTGKGIPGDLFFALARSLGRLASAEPGEEMKFWMAEERRVYDTWQPNVAVT